MRSIYCYDADLPDGSQGNGKKRWGESTKARWNGGTQIYPVGFFLSNWDDADMRNLHGLAICDGFDEFCPQIEWRRIEG